MIGQRVTAPRADAKPDLLTKLNATKDTVQRTAVYPFFRFETYETGMTDRFRIAKRETGGGDSGLYVPFRGIETDRTFIQTIQDEITDSWTIDLSQTGINLTTLIGGIIDETTLVASSDYLIWAFLDPTQPVSSRFKGFGLSKRPNMAYTAVATGTKGATGTFTVSGAGNNRGTYFVIGSRVLVRQGVVVGNEYNQGTVVDRANGSVSVLLDNNAAYGTNITVAAGTIIQLDRFEPRSGTISSTYPSTGALPATPYIFSYIGMVQSSSTSIVLRVRYPTNRYEWPDVVSYNIRSVTLVGGGAGATDTATVSLAQWMPVGNLAAMVLIRATKTGGPAASIGTVSIALNAAGQSSRTLSDMITVGKAQRMPVTPLTVSPLDASVYCTTITPAATTITADFFLQGFEEWRW